MVRPSLSNVQIILFALYIGTLYFGMRFWTNYQGIPIEEERDKGMSKNYGFRDGRG